MFWDIAKNRKSFGAGHVYDPNAHWIKQTGQIAKYSFGNLFRFYGMLMDAAEAGDINELEKEEQKKIFEEGLSQFDRVLLSVFGYKYTRSNLNERKVIMTKYLDKEFTSRKYDILRKYEGEQRSERLQGLIKWRAKCIKWIQEDMQ